MRATVMDDAVVVNLLQPESKAEPAGLSISSDSIVSESPGTVLTPLTFSLEDPLHDY